MDVIPSPEESPEGEDDEDEAVAEKAARALQEGQGLLKIQANNENTMLRSEVKWLRRKVETMEKEKDEMIDNFRVTTQVLLDRIKDLEMQVSDANSRPQTAAILEKIEPTKSGTARPPRMPGVPGLSASSRDHHPEILRIDEGDEHMVSPRDEEAPMEGHDSEEGSPSGDSQICGNCGILVPAGNLVTHSIHCYRNTFRCTHCDEILSCKDREEHMKYWTDPERLFAAADKSDAETLQMMEKHGADLAEVRDTETGNTVLHIAARKGNIDMISFSMGRGVDINPVNKSGASPLHLAVEKSGSLPAVRLLVELGAELNLCTASGDTPLILCCRRKDGAEVAKYLMEMKADPEISTSLGDTALQIAQRLGHHDTVMAMSLKGANLRPGSGTPRRHRDASPSPGTPRDQSFRSGYSSGVPAPPPVPRMPVPRPS